jgi:hypothetical protein
MVQIIPKWKVRVLGKSGTLACFFVSDMHIGNVLTLCARLDFGLGEAEGFEVQLVPDQAKFETVSGAASYQMRSTGDSEVTLR